MAQTALANLGINFEHTLGTDDWKNSYDGNWIVTDWSLQAYVINRTTTAEPGSPAVGDAYLLGTSRTGTDWGSDSLSVANSIAIYANIPGLTDASKWIYLVPREGWLVYDRAANIWWRYNGTKWVAKGRTVPAAITTGTSSNLDVDTNSVKYIDNTAHTFTLKDNATIPHDVGDELLIINEHNNAITVAKDAAVSFRAGSQNLVAAGIAGNSICRLLATGTDEWMVLQNALHPT